MNLICKFFGHNKTGKRFSVFRFIDGKVSWISTCSRCKKKLFCLKGVIKSRPSYISTTELL